MIEIWSPRYSTNSVLVAVYKVSKGENHVKFIKAKHLAGMVFKFDGAAVMQKCPIETNGKISCYAIPMDMLERIS